MARYKTRPRQAGEWTTAELVERHGLAGFSALVSGLRGRRPPDKPLTEVLRTKLPALQWLWRWVPSQGYVRVSSARTAADAWASLDAVCCCLCGRSDLFPHSERYCVACAGLLRAHQPRVRLAKQLIIQRNRRLRQAQRKALLRAYDEAT
jgi:hypothetical protein